MHKLGEETPSILNYPKVKHDLGEYPTREPALIQGEAREIGRYRQQVREGNTFLSPGLSSRHARQLSNEVADEIANEVSLFEAVGE